MCLSFGHTVWHFFHPTLLCLSGGLITTVSKELVQQLIHQELLGVSFCQEGQPSVPCCHKQKFIENWLTGLVEPRQKHKKSHPKLHVMYWIVMNSHTITPVAGMFCHMFTVLSATTYMYCNDAFSPFYYDFFVW